MDNPSFQPDDPNTIIIRTSANGSNYLYGSTKEDANQKEIPKNVELKRQIGFFGAVSFIMGSVIGAGIFISPKGVLLSAGSPGLSLVIWVICGSFSLIGCYAFAELGTLIPKSGGQYIFLLDAYAPDRHNRKPHWWQPLIAFLYNWQVTLFSRPGGLAVLTLTFSEYIVRLGALHCPDIILFKSPPAAVKLIAVCALLLLWFINITSVKLAARLQIIFTTAKVVALIILVLCGILTVFQEGSSKLNLGFEDSKYEYGNIAGAFYSGMWAYSGWDNICMITKELKNPSRNIPLALFVSMTTVTLIYLAVNVAYLTVLSADEILSSNAVAVSFCSRVAGHVGVVLIVASVACSTFGSANGGLFTISRLCNVAAREGHMNEVISYLHVKHLSPATAITLTTVISIFFVFATEILTLIMLGGFIDGLFLTLCMGAFLILRQTKKHEKRTVKAPLIFPVLFMLFALFLFLTPLVGRPKVEYIYILLFVFSGVLFYLPFVHFQVKVPGMAYITRNIQIIFDVVPPEHH